MNATKKTSGMDMKEKLSLLWIFAVLNYLYADVLGLFDPKTLKEVMTGTVGGLESSEVHEKRLLLKMALQNLELMGKKARYDWINPFDKIAFYASRQAWLRREDSNLRPFP